MKFARVDIELHPGTLTSDRCTRSGLSANVSLGSNGPVTFSTLFTTNFAEMSDFYRELLGKENLRIDGDGLLVFDVASGSIVIKRVSEDSRFAKLTGHQSLGLQGMEQRLSMLPNNSLAKDFGWDTTVSQCNDPDGNTIISVAAEEAAEQLPNAVPEPESNPSVREAC